MGIFDDTRQTSSVCRQSGSNRRPLDYETNATTNCAIAAATKPSRHGLRPPVLLEAGGRGGRGI